MPKSPEMLDATELAEAWWKTFHGQRLTVKQIIMQAREEAPSELHRVLVRIAPSDYKDQISPNKLARWLVTAANVVMIMEGKTYRFINRGIDDTRRQTWQLASLAEPTYPRISVEEALATDLP